MTLRRTFMVDVIRRNAAPLYCVLRELFRINTEREIDAMLAVAQL